MLKILIAGLITTALVWFFVSEDRILKLVERDLSGQLDKVLSVADAENADYFVAGRDIIVQVHAAKGNNAVALLEAKLAAIPGVARVLLTGGAVEESEVAIAAAALSSSNNTTTFAQIQFNGNDLTLVGAASAAEQTNELLAQLGQKTDVNILNYLEYKPHYSSEWLGLLTAYTTLFPSPETGRVLVSDKAISIALDNSSAAMRLEQELTLQGISLPIRVYGQEAVSVTDNNAIPGTSSEVSIASASGNTTTGDISNTATSFATTVSSATAVSPVADVSASGAVSPVTAAANPDSSGNSSNWSVEACNAQLTALISSSPIAFKYNSDDIEDSSMQALNEVRRIVESCNEEVLVVSGHTDDYGSAEFNRLLSQRRASSVRSVIVGDALPEWRVEAIGYGEEYPIDTNETEDGRARNRRIEMKFAKERQSITTEAEDTRLSEIVPQVYFVEE